MSDSQDSTALTGPTLKDALEGTQVRVIMVALPGSGLSTVLGAVTDFGSDVGGMVTIVAPHLILQTKEGLRFEPLVRWTEAWSNWISRHLIVASAPPSTEMASAWVDLLAAISTNGPVGPDLVENTTQH